MRAGPTASYLRCMSTTERITDTASVARLSSGLNRCFETFEPGAGIFADDAFFDLYPPLWRFQLQGPEAFATQLRAIAEGPCEARVLDVVPTASGFVMEHEEVQRRRRDDVHRAAAVPLRGARWPDHRGRVLLQRRMGRGVACPSRRRGADAAAVGDATMSTAAVSAVTAADVLAAVRALGPSDRRSGRGDRGGAGAPGRPARRSPRRRRLPPPPAGEPRRAGGRPPGRHRGVRGAGDGRRVDGVDDDDRRRRLDRSHRPAAGDVRRHLRRWARRR